MILYHYKNEKVIRMRRAIKRGLIVALGVIIQILLSLSVLIFFRTENCGNRNILLNIKCSISFTE